MLTEKISTLDFQCYKNGSSRDRQVFCQQLGNAFQQIGFVAIKNHSIDKSLLLEAQTLIKDFFRLPDSVKKKYQDPNFTGQRGYKVFQPVSSSHLNNAEYKESWQMTREQTLVNLSSSSSELAFQKDQFLRQNYWPQEINLKPVFQNLFTEFEKLTSDILDACSYFLDIPHHYLQNHLSDHESFLRTLFYPKVTGEYTFKQERLSSHEDLSLITLLWTSSEHGLEVLNKQYSWIQVNPTEDSILINVGKLFTYITNNTFRSALHRVTVTDNIQERYSFPFFVLPNFGLKLKPLRNESFPRLNEPNFEISTAEYIRMNISNLPNH